MSKFKAGDTVVCIEEGRPGQFHHPLTLGKTYKVTSSNNVGGLFLDDNNLWHSERYFELATDKQVYKVGDKIRAIRSNPKSNYPLKVGKVYEIHEITQTGAGAYLANHATKAFWYNFNNFEPVKSEFKVGDKIRCIEKDAALEVGNIYTVKQVFESAGYGGVIITTEEQTPSYFMKNFELYTNELEDFKKQVVTAALNHPSGCKEGKKEFLAALGLELPAPKLRKYEVTFEWTEPHEGRAANGGVDLVRWIKNSIGGWDGHLGEVTAEEVES